LHAFEKAQKETISIAYHTVVREDSPKRPRTSMKGNEIRWPQYSGERGRNTLTENEIRLSASANPTAPCSNQYSVLVLRE